jgi:hypothetical protein
LILRNVRRHRFDLARDGIRTVGALLVIGVDLVSTLSAAGGAMSRSRSSAPGSPPIKNNRQVRALAQTEASRRLPSRAVIGEIMTALRSEIQRRSRADLAARANYLRGDRALEEDAVRAICARAGIEPEAYHLAVQSDPALLALYHCALEEALVGAVDPGPNAQISRESPTGTESNDHWNDWMTRGNSP